MLFNLPLMRFRSEDWLSLMCVANQNHRAAILAPPDAVVLGELPPVPLLIRGEYAQTLTERTDVIQRVQDRRTNELGTVGHAFQDFSKPRFHLEGDHFVLVLLR
jgi:hypothetical protein